MSKNNMGRNNIDREAMQQQRLELQKQILKDRRDMLLSRKNAMLDRKALIQSGEFTNQKIALLDTFLNSNSLGDDMRSHLESQKSAILQDQSGFKANMEATIIEHINFVEASINQINAAIDGVIDQLQSSSSSEGESS